METSQMTATKTEMNHQDSKSNHTKQQINVNNAPIELAIFNQSLNSSNITQNQIRTLNLFSAQQATDPTNSLQQQTKHIILNKASIINKSLQQNGTMAQAAQSVIVLAPTSRTLNDNQQPNIQFLIQQKPTANIATSNSPSTLHQKINLPTAGSINLIKNIQINSSSPKAANMMQNLTRVEPSSQQKINEIMSSPVQKLEYPNSANSHIIGLLNSNRNMDSNKLLPHKSNCNSKFKKIEKDVVDVSNNNNQTVASLINSRLQQIRSNQYNIEQNKKEITPIATIVNPVQLENQMNTFSQNKKQLKCISTSINLPNEMRESLSGFHDQIQTNASIDSALNQLILPDTRIFASLLNKDDKTESEKCRDGVSDLKCKKVFMGNREHIILDNFNNLSDFKGNLNDLRSIAASIADTLNMPVSIPAFLIIEDDSIVKVKEMLNQQNINPIIINTNNSNQQGLENQNIEYNQKQCNSQPTMPVENTNVTNDSETPEKKLEVTKKKVIRKKKPASTADNTSQLPEKVEKPMTKIVVESNKPKAVKKPKTKVREENKLAENNFQEPPKKKVKVEEIANSEDTSKIIHESKPNSVYEEFQFINQFIDTLNSNETSTNVVGEMNTNESQIMYTHNANSITTEKEMPLVNNNSEHVDLTSNQLDASTERNGNRKNSINDCELAYDQFDVNLLFNDIEF